MSPFVFSRLLRTGAHLGCALATRPEGRGERRAYRRRWARGLLDRLGIALDSAPVRIGPGTLVVANHVSWLDILVLSTLVDCSFVAKAETSRWPLLGPLLRAHDTLFVVRRPGRHLRGLNARIRERLDEGGVVVVFPEATTSDGSGVLPFKTALFQPAIDGGHRVQPLALHYLRGSRRCAEAAFVGDQGLLGSLFRIAAVPGLSVRVEWSLPFPARGLDRREAARTARSAVQSCLWSFGPDVPRERSVPPGHAVALRAT